MTGGAGVHGTLGHSSDERMRRLCWSGSAASEQQQRRPPNLSQEACTSNSTDAGLAMAAGVMYRYYVCGSCCLQDSLQGSNQVYACCPCVFRSTKCTALQTVLAEPLWLLHCYSIAVSCVFEMLIEHKPWHIVLTCSSASLSRRSSILTQQQKASKQAVQACALPRSGALLMSYGHHGTEHRRMGGRLVCMPIKASRDLSTNCLMVCIQC